MDKIRRICIYGGPGSGKSTLASFLFYNLKSDGFRIEHVSEYIKLWTYIPRKPVSWDSFYCQAKQITKEDIILRGMTDHIVTDSPVFLQYFYSKYHNEPGQQSMLYASREFEEQYPSFNIFLRRPENYKYDNVGRYESQDEAKLIDEKVIEMLNGELKEFQIFDYTRSQDILTCIKNRLNKK